MSVLQWLISACLPPQKNLLQALQKKPVFGTNKSKPVWTHTRLKMSALCQLCAHSSGSPVLVGDVGCLTDRFAWVIGGKGAGWGLCWGRLLLLRLLRRLPHCERGKPPSAQAGRVPTIRSLAATRTRLRSRSYCRVAPPRGLLHPRRWTAVKVGGTRSFTFTSSSI